MPCVLVTGADRGIGAALVRAYRQRGVRAIAACLGAGQQAGDITSRVGSIGDNGSGGSYGYRMSKCAANQLGVNLYHELKPRGIAMILLHPGQVATAMTLEFGGLVDFITPEAAAAGLIGQLDLLDAHTPPEFRHSNGSLLPW